MLSISVPAYNIAFEVFSSSLSPLPRYVYIDIANRGQYQKVANDNAGINPDNFCGEGEIPR